MTTPLRVLVVDDSAYIRKVVKEMLSRSPDLEVVGTARDSEEALEQVERLRPDVVTCDLIMPGTDGVDFIQRQMSRRRVPIVIVSMAGESSERVLSGLDAGAIDFVQKPTALATEQRVRGCRRAHRPRFWPRRARRCVTRRKLEQSGRPSRTRSFKTDIVCWSSASRPAGLKA